MKNLPAGIMAPLEETRFELKGDELARLAALRREKQERLRAGNLDRQTEPGELPRTRARQSDDHHPITQEETVLATEKPRAKVPPFKIEFGTAKPPKPEPPTADGLDSLSPGVRRVYDVFERLAPGGREPVRQSLVAAELGISAPQVSIHVAAIRKAGLWHAGWDAGFGAKKKQAAAETKPPATKPSNPSEPPKSSPVATPPPEPPPPDSPAARSLASHATKHRVTADERRAREADAERMTPVACEVPRPTAIDEPTQVGGDHYTSLGVQPWDAIEAWLTPEGTYGYHVGCVVAYVARASRKGGLEDLRKARHTLDRLVTLVEQGKAACRAVVPPDASTTREEPRA